MKTLVIDFETANTSPDSACELGLVVVEASSKQASLFPDKPQKLDTYQIVHSERFLIRPPTPNFAFTYIHGITWEQVKEAPTFGEIWEQSLARWFSEPFHLAAHNVGFDKRVLESTAAHYNIKLPYFTTECTVQISRSQLNISPAKLSNVCETLGIKLNHHAALSDAMASAYIYMYSKTGQKHWE